MKTTLETQYNERIEQIQRELPDVWQCIRFKLRNDHTLKAWIACMSENLFYLWLKNIYDAPEEKLKWLENHAKSFEMMKEYREITGYTYEVKEDGEDE